MSITHFVQANYLSMTKSMRLCHSKTGQFNKLCYYLLLNLHIMLSIQKMTHFVNNVFSLLEKSVDQSSSSHRTISSSIVYSLQNEFLSKNKFYKISALHGLDEVSYTTQHDFIIFKTSLSNI